ncbi:MAG TPA: hypothetical protein VNT01_05180 [Symbiobacteriaceae bacterium]|nr:hypothetical protein [Symbiobacteriaceae bacterium]
MIAEETWRRYTAHWGALALAGLFATLVSLIVVVLGFILVVPVMISTGVSFALLGADGGAALASMATAGFGVLLLMLLAVVLVAPIAQGGLLHAVIQVQRDQPAAFGELWQAGLRHWGRLFRLDLICAGIGLLSLPVLLILTLVPFLGPAVWFFGMSMIMLPLAGYGPYIAVSEETGAREAAGRAFRILSAKFADVLLTLLIFLAAFVVLSVVETVLSLVPGVRALVPWAVQIFVSPLIILYLAVRYQRNIAPDLGPPGGQGSFYPGPPPGV